MLKETKYFLPLQIVKSKEIGEKTFYSSKKLKRF